MSYWSSDVCSSDLRYEQRGQQRETLRLLLLARIAARQRPERVGARLQLSQFLAHGAESGLAVAGHGALVVDRQRLPEEGGMDVATVAVRVTNSRQTLPVSLWPLAPPTRPPPG